MTDFNVDNIISSIRSGNSVEESNVLQVLAKLQEILYNENTIIEVQSPTYIVGDIHGQLYDLFNMFDTLNPKGTKNLKYVFMGDYVDRGRFSLDTFIYLAAHKVKYPKQFFLLRGNHECRTVNAAYGFYSETLQNFGHSGIWLLCNEIFDLLPLAAVIDNKIFSVHGGLSPRITLIDSINMFDRQIDLPTSGPFADLVWSDPDADCTEWRPNVRGAGWMFGKRQVDAFCHQNKIQLITRSHQLAMNGFQSYFNDKLYTVWSAPNYMYRAGNKATVMKIEPDSGKFYSLTYFEACPNDKRKIVEDTSLSQYFV